MIEKIKNYSAKFLLNKAEKFNEDFENRKKANNFRRMKFLFIFATIYTFILFVLELLKGDYNLIFYLQSSVLVISVIFLYVLFKKMPEINEKNKSINDIIFYLSLIFLAAWPALRAGILSSNNTSMLIYILTIFFISVIFYIKWEIYLSLFALLSIIILSFKYFNFGLNYNFVESILIIGNTYIFGFIASRVSYINLMEDVIKLKKTENKYKNLSNDKLRLKSILSDKKEKELELKEKIEEIKSELSFVLKNSNSGMWEWHIENDRVIFNKEWAKMLDYHVNKLDGRLETWRELIHPLDRKDFDKLVKKIKDGEKRSFKFEHRLKSGDGEWRWMLAQGEVIDIDENGNALKIIGLHHDFTEKKKIEKKLNYCEHSFNKILSSLPFAVMLYKKGGWQFINEGAEKLLGYDRKELLNKSNWKFIDSDHSELLNKSFREKKGKYHKMKIIDKIGNKKLVDFYAKKITIEEEEMIILIAFEE